MCTKDKISFDFKQQIKSYSTEMKKMNFNIVIDDILTFNNI